MRMSVMDLKIIQKKNNKKFCQDKSSNLHIWKTKILPM